MQVDRLTKDEWKELAEDAHFICFRENRPASVDRIDFALLAVHDNGDPAAYMTLREIDDESIYLQYGGSFKPGNISSYRSYTLMLKRLKELGYKTAQTYIENTNTPMMKFANKVGWIITGIRFFGTSILIEHVLDFGTFNE